MAQECRLGPAVEWTTALIAPPWEIVENAQGHQAEEAKVVVPRGGGREAVDRAEMSDQSAVAEVLEAKVRQAHLALKRFARR